MLVRCALPILALTLVLSACNKEEKHEADSTTAEPSTTAAAVETPATPEAGPASDIGPNPVVVFDTRKVSVSDKTLGAFPFISLPAGTKFNTRPDTREFHRLYFVVGEGNLHAVEGRTLKATVVNDSDVSGNSQFSPLLVERNFDRAISDLGGVKVFEGVSNNKQLRPILDDKTQHDYFPGDLYNNKPWKTWLTRTVEVEVWVGLACNSSYCDLTIVQKGDLPVTSKPIPAAAMKEALDKDGQIALNILFDVDKATIKAESLPIVAEIVKLLESDSLLKVRIEGHTDNTGEKAHNQMLSVNRAAAVQTAIVAKGITPARLQSAGFGDTRPVADNATDAGKTQNRRVVIVRIS